MSFDADGNPTQEFMDSDEFFEVERVEDLDFEALGAAPVLQLERRCRKCGCTDARACMTAEGPCYWVETDLCSACRAPLLYGADGEPLVAA